MEDFQISGITYDKSLATFYKISVVNNSKLKAINTRMFDLWGPLLYASGSTIEFVDQTSIYNNTNDDRDNPLVQIYHSTLLIEDSELYDLASDYYSPICNF